MNFFKQFFEGTKKDKTRQNLMVSLDNHETGDHEVLVIKTTSGQQISLEFNVGQNHAKVAVNPNDLQDALDRIHAFIAARGTQPKTYQALGAKHLEAQKQEIGRAEEQIKQQEKVITETKILDLGN